MKRLASTYSITGRAITMTGVNVPLAQILLIADATTGAVIYSIGGTPAASYTQATNSIITLASSVTISNSDALTIYYDDGLAVETTPVTQSGTWSPTLPVGQQAMASSTPVVIASNQSTIPVSSAVSNTSAVTVVASATTGSVAASSTRTGLIFYSGGAGDVYILLGTGTISGTSPNFTPISFHLSTGDIVALNSYTGAFSYVTTGTTAFFITTLTP
jgi:hypothetical protein